jgi:hypothetical protein
MAVTLPEQVSLEQFMQLTTEQRKVVAHKPQTHAAILHALYVTMLRYASEMGRDFSDVEKVLGKEVAQELLLSLPEKLGNNGHGFASSSLLRVGTHYEPEQNSLRSDPEWDDFCSLEQTLMEEAELVTSPIKGSVQSLSSVGFMWLGFSVTKSFDSPDEVKAKILCAIDRYREFRAKGNIERAIQCAARIGRLHQRLLWKLDDAERHALSRIKQKDALNSTSQSIKKAADQRRQKQFTAEFVLVNVEHPERLSGSAIVRLLRAAAKKRPADPAGEEAWSERFLDRKDISELRRAGFLPPKKNKG